MVTLVRVCQERVKRSLSYELPPISPLKLSPNHDAFADETAKSRFECGTPLRGYFGPNVTRHAVNVTDPDLFPLGRFPGDINNLGILVQRDIRIRSNSFIFVGKPRV